MRREVSVVNKKVNSFPILFALLALLIGTCAVVFPASAQAAPTSTGSITVSGTVASSYDAYQIFSANVVDGDSDAKIATDFAWASDAARDAALPVLHSAGMPKSQTTAQEAAEWLNADSHLTSALSAQLARSLQSSGAAPALRAADTASALTTVRASFAVSEVVMCPSAFIHSAASCAVDAEPSSPAS